MIDYVLSRDLADGVVITGCREGECNYRLGPRWTEERIEGARDPRLRSRVPRARIARIWAAPTDRQRFETALRAFQSGLDRLPVDTPAGNPAAAATEEAAR